MSAGMLHLYLYKLYTIYTLKAEEHCTNKAMRNTKTMLLGMSIFIITVLLINTVVWYLEDTWTFKDCFAHGGTIGVSFIFGWLPAAVVGHDYYKRI